MVDITTFSGKGGPLTAAEFDANLNAIKSALEAYLASLIPVVDMSLDANGTHIIVSVNGVQQVSYEIPSTVIYNWRGNYVTGVLYLADDLIFGGRSVYVAKSAFQSTNLQADFTNGNLGPFALGGGSGWLNRGVYDAAVAYNPQDAVLDSNRALWVWEGAAASAPGTAPGTSNWIEIAPIPSIVSPTYVDKGAYDAATVYHLYDVCQDGSGNTWAWTSPTPSIAGTAPAIGAGAWAEYVNAAGWSLTWKGFHDPSQAYNPNDLVVDEHLNQYVWAGATPSVAGVALGTGDWRLTLVGMPTLLTTPGVYDVAKAQGLDATLAAHKAAINALIDNCNMLITHVGYSTLPSTSPWPTSAPSAYTAMTKV